MRKLGFFGIAMVVMLAGIAAWAAQAIPRLKPQLDPLRSTRYR